MAYYLLKINLGGIEMDFATGDVSVVKTQLDEYFNLIVSDEIKSVKPALKEKKVYEAKKAYEEPAPEPEILPEVKLFEPAAEPEILTEVISGPEPQILAEVEPALEPEVESTVEPEIELRDEPAPEPVVEPEPVAAHAAELTVEQKVEPEVEPVIEPQIESAPEPEIMPADESKAEFEAETFAIFDRVDHGSDYESEVRPKTELEDMIKYNLEYVQKELLSPEEALPEPVSQEAAPEETVLGEIASQEAGEINLETTLPLQPKNELAEFMKRKVSHSLFDDFLITAFFIKNVLGEESFSIKSLNSKLYSAAEKLVDYSIVEDVVKCDYAAVCENHTPDSPMLYTITPRGEYYYNSLQDTI